MPKGPKEFSVSSNGDRWFLERDATMPGYTVIHRASPAAGGAETRWTISDFLEVAGTHPQGQALRDILPDLKPCDSQSSEVVEPKLPRSFPWTSRPDHTGD